MVERDASGRDQAIRRGQLIRVALLAVLILAAVVLALDNRRDVRLSWLFGETTAPLIIALVVAFVLGWGVGWLSARRKWR